MNEFVMKLRILMRAEVTLFKADAQRRANMALLGAISIGCVFVALIFVNMGLFFRLTDSDLDSRAAFILAGGNLALAVVPFLFRRQAKAGPEEQMVREIREMAAEDVSKDLDAVAKEVADIGAGINQVRSGVAAFNSGGMSALMPGVNLVIEMLKKKR